MNRLRKSKINPGGFQPAPPQPDEISPSLNMEAISRLTRRIAHDLNNILTPITLCGQLLERECPQGHPLHPEISDIVLASEKGRELSEILSRMGRPSKLTFEAVDLDAFLSPWLKEFQNTWGKRVAISTHLGLSPSRIRADQQKLKEILTPCLVNAAESIQDTGQLTISTTLSKQIDPSSKSPLPMGCLILEDSGCGIDPRAQPFVFEPFYSTDENGLKKGLGLTLAYKLIGEHHGEIRFCSRKEKGSTFKLLFPLYENKKG